jgi:hypothetical protein
MAWDDAYYYACYSKFVTGLTKSMKEVFATQSQKYMWLKEQDPMIPSVSNGRGMCGMGHVHHEHGY